MKNIVVNLLIALMLVNLWTISIEARTSSLLPTDDTYVQRSSPNNSFDGGGLLVSYSNFWECDQTRISYLRFDISSFTQDVDSKTQIRIYIAIKPTFIGENISIFSTGNDWNGSNPGIGNETSLTWNNQPGPIDKLDTQKAFGSGWVIFSGSSLSNYINNQRSSHGGDNIVSFMIKWDSCAGLSNDITFEDRENTKGTGSEPFQEIPGNMVYLPFIGRYTHAYTQKYPRFH